MKIKKIIIENFKFHHHLEFEIRNNNNCLIYGENGSGKSSIYEALYSNFYYYKNIKIANGIIKIRDTFLHRDFPSGNFRVNILFNNSINFNRTDETLSNDTLLLEPESNPEQGKANVYFANEKVLRNITDDNFFNIIENELIIHFPELSKVISCYKDVNKSLSLLKDAEQINEEIIKQRKEADELCKTKLNELIPFTLINSILENNLLCDFKIEYSFKESNIDINKKFHSPLINFKIMNIDDRGDFRNHFNEAKLKLISIAVYFALVKKNQTQNELKLNLFSKLSQQTILNNKNLSITLLKPPKLKPNNTINFFSPSNTTTT
jgi:predicted ATP-dependent endonuclease of OLD family